MTMRTTVDDGAGRNTLTMLGNFAAFQVGWFAAVLSATARAPWLGVLVMAAVILLHLRSVDRPLPELVLVALCGAIGCVWDSLLVMSGWVAYPSGMLLPGFAPYWIVAMWMLFATTLNQSLGWLKSRRLLAVALGAAGGPLSYYAGAKLGGIALLAPGPAMLALAVGWGILMPSLLTIAARYDGVTIEADAEHGWVLD